MNKTTISITVGIFIGAISGAALYSVLATDSNHSASHALEDANANNSSNEPLYWVAPMDPNFKRDKPGKSPMGMDLVPVYANDAAQDSPGTIEIDPLIVQNLGVKTAPVKKVLPSRTINSFGTVHYAQNKISHVHPRVEGWVETLYVSTQGDTVQKGEPLYSLYSPELVNAQEEYLIALEQSNRALITGAKSRLLALNASETLLEEIEKSRDIQRTITFYASQNGVVSELNIQEGFYVKPETTMLAIASLDSVWVLADIFASDLSKINVGDTANITFDYLPSLSIEAELTYIYPSINANTRTASARFIVPNPNLALKPDMYADLVIHSSSSKQVLAVPESAVIRTGSQDRVVLALGDGKFKSIEVALGAKYDNIFEVLSGVNEHDLVVTSAQFLLDSESSISSDFLRMEGAVDVHAHDNKRVDSSMTMDDMNTNNKGTDEQDSADKVEQQQISAWTQATVNEVMRDSRKVNLTHGPLDAFNMMGMTMNFDVAAHIDIEQFAEGQSVHIEVVKGDSGMYQINNVHFMDSGEQP